MLAHSCRRNLSHGHSSHCSARRATLHCLAVACLTVCCCPPTPPAALCCCKRQTSLAETARLVRCHNPWPAEDILFCPNDALPAFVTGIPALSSGPELWIAIHNHRPEPLQLHSGQNIGVLEVMTLADAPPTASQPGPPRRPPLPERSHRSSSNS